MKKKQKEKTITLQLGDQSTKMIPAIILVYIKWRNSNSRN